MRNFHFSRALLPEGWADDVVIAVDGAGTIAGIGVGEPCPPFTDRLAGVAIPGLANLHSHAHQRAMVGLTERAGPEWGAGADSFWTWRQTMYGLLQMLDPDDLQAVAMHAYIEMLQAGTTHVAEFHYLHHGPDGQPYADPAEMSKRLAEAARQVGIGLTLLPVFYDASGFDGAPCTAAQRRFACDADAFLALHGAARAALAPGMVAGVAPHSLRAATPGGLERVLAACPDGPVHIHVAEQVQEVEACLAARGQRPVAWLLDHAAVDARWCLVHATHTDDGEVQAMAARGATAGLCPTTEADLGDGLFPAAAFVAAGGRFGIGSDSQVSASGLEELRLLEWGQRLATGRRAVLAGAPGQSTGRALLEAAGAGGAAACGVAVGAIEVGMRADVAVLDPGFAAGLPGDLVLDTAIFGARGNPVRHVVAAGECVVRDGAHRLQSIAARGFGQVLTRLASAM